MKTITTEYEGRTLSCTVKAAPRVEIRIDREIDSDLLPEAVVYGGLRALCKSSLLREALVPQSYRLRLAKGKKGRPLPLEVYTTGCWFDQRHSVQAQLTVLEDRDGVTLTGVWLRSPVKLLTAEG